MNDAVLYSRDEGVGQILLNRPDNRNSMTGELLDAFVEAISEAKADTGLRCLVITGEGRCFSAGADFKSQIQRDQPGQQPHERSYAMYEPFLSVLDVNVPVLGALNGHAVGGGFGLALVCDLRIAAVEAKYGANFTRLGLHPGMSVSYLLPRLVGLARASEWLYTGRLFDGEEGMQSGLFNRALPTHDVFPETLSMARDIAANGPIAVRMTKRSIYRGLGWQPKAAAFDEAYAQAVTVATDDAKEGMRALLEKRDPEFYGR